MLMQESPKKLFKLSNSQSDKVKSDQRALSGNRDRDGGLSLLIPC